MSEVAAAEFRNSQGVKLFATLHRPDLPRAGAPAVVLLSPGVKMRVGPGRLYVPLTDALNADGFTVLRFDFYGLGDSEGELQETVLADVYNNIEVGRYIDDTLAAMKWLREQHGFDRFVLGGLCGGAITAVLAAQREARVVGLLSIGMTVTLASNAATPAKYLTLAELDVRRRGYYQRLLDPKSWWRLLTFQSEYGVIWRSMKQLLFKEKAIHKAPAPASPTPPDARTEEQRGNANPLFPEAFFAFLGRGGKAFMLFSEKDRLQAEYEEKFARPFAAKLQSHSSQIDGHMVANANHVLALREWQLEMVAASMKWMSRQFGG